MEYIHGGGALRCEWDPAKADANVARHEIDFVVAAKVFAGPRLEVEHTRRNYGERRMRATGAADERVLTVTYTMRGDVYRLISARRANRREERAYRASRDQAGSTMAEGEDRLGQS